MMMVDAMCAACLGSPGSVGKLRSEPTLRYYYDLLLDSQTKVKVEDEGAPWGVCWQCEGALLGVRRLQRRVVAAQLAFANMLAQLWRLEEAAPALVAPRLTPSPALVITTPGHMKLSTSVTSGKLDMSEHVMSHVDMEQESPSSEDEALSLLRTRKLEELSASRETSPLSSPWPQSDCNSVRRKKKMPRQCTKFKKVLINDNEIHSEADSDGSVARKNKRTKTIKQKDNSKNKEQKGRQNERFRKVVISEEEMLAGREEERLMKWFVQAPYKCETCIIGYYNENTLQEHLRVKHDQSLQYWCEVCAMRCVQPRRLARHLALHYRRIECRLCGARHRAYRDMWRHYVRAHEPGKTFPCALCPRVFQTRPSLVYHRRCDHRERCKCEQCGNTFRNQTTYKRHLLIHTGMPRYECGVCLRSYRGKFGFLTHMKTHGPPPRDAYCVECDVQYKHAFQYRRHLKISARHQADLASSTDRPKANKYACPACEKKFVSPSVLKRHHDSVHLKLKRYECNQCDKNYATPAALWTHRKLQHERVVPPRDKVCEVCGKGFRSNTSLVDHMRCHTGERPFSCDACQATFRHNSGLYMHKRLVHKMNKKRTDNEGATESFRTDLPLACRACPATFRHTSGLYVHGRLAHAHHAAASAAVDQENTVAVPAS